VHCNVIAWELLRGGGGRSHTSVDPCRSNIGGSGPLWPLRRWRLCRYSRLGSKDPAPKSKLLRAVGAWVFTGRTTMQMCPSNDVPFSDDLWDVAVPAVSHAARRLGNSTGRCIARAHYCSMSSNQISSARLSFRPSVETKRITTTQLWQQVAACSRHLTVLPTV